MLFKTHLAFSFFILVLFWPLLPVDEAKAAFAIIWVLASLIPDIDSTKSILGRFFKPVGWVLRHRFWLHSVFSAVILSVLIAFIDVRMAYAVFLGYVSHLFLDMFNHQGIAIFYPFSKFRIRGPLKTGKTGERVVFIASVAGIILTSL